jgi:hypothetical protein
MDFKFCNYANANSEIISDFSADWFKTTYPEFLATGMVVETLSGVVGQIIDMYVVNNHINLLLEDYHQKNEGKTRRMIVRMAQINYQFFHVLYENDQSVVVKNEFGYMDVEGMWNDIYANDKFDEGSDTEFYDFMSQCLVTEDNDKFTPTQINELSDINMTYDFEFDYIPNPVVIPKETFHPNKAQAFKMDVVARKS